MIQELIRKGKLEFLSSFVLEERQDLVLELKIKYIAVVVVIILTRSDIFVFILLLN